MARGCGFGAGRSTASVEKTWWVMRHLWRTKKRMGRHMIATWMRVRGIGSGSFEAVEPSAYESGCMPLSVLRR